MTLFYCLTIFLLLACSALFACKLAYDLGYERGFTRGAQLTGPTGPTGGRR